VLARKAGREYVPDYIEKLAHAAVQNDEELLRVLYYDCAPYRGEAKLPVSGEKKKFSGSDTWLKKLAEKELFAVRLGDLKFRGFKPKRIPVAPTTLTDNDFRPDFEQKGVDMRIGLDIATFSSNRTVDRIVLMSGDMDCIPAMKHCRKAGLQVVLATFPEWTPAPALSWHADFLRAVDWPEQ